MLAAIGSSTYNLFLLLHVLSVIVAFAPAFVWPVVNASMRGRGEVPAGVRAQAARNTMTVHGPATVLAGLFGILLIVTSEEVWEFSQAWVSGAFLVWFVILGIQLGALLPAERKAAAGDAKAEKMVGMFSGITHLLLIVMLYLMIWKPGL